MVYSCTLAIICLLFHLSNFSSSEAHNDGFSVNLIRKNTSHVSSHLMGSSNKILNTLQAPVNAYNGQHLMELSIGTPPVKIYGIADTGSDVVWTQCVPCNNCYKQLNPLFDPQMSSTYTSISCDSELCLKLETRGCSPKNSCNYTYEYGDSSITQGDLAQETVSLTSTTGETVPLKGFVFGCGHNDTGTFNDHEMGIIGLGGGPLSLISQIGSSFGGKKFSQCLVPFHTDVGISSRMSFGKGSEVLGNDVVSTPLILNGDYALYQVTLLGISVENTYLPFNISSSGTITKGNMIIDSGTPPIILPQSLYDRVFDEVRNKVAMEPISDDSSLGPQLCYRTQNNLSGPTITIHFEGANVFLTPTQTFVPPKDGIFCLAFTNTSDNGGIYGNFAQSNYLIGFDLDKQLVSFKSTDCTKL